RQASQGPRGSEARESPAQAREGRDRPGDGTDRREARNHASSQSLGSVSAGRPPAYTRASKGRGAQGRRPREALVSGAARRAEGAGRLLGGGRLREAQRQPRLIPLA